MTYEEYLRTLAPGQHLAVRPDVLVVQRPHHPGVDLVGRAERGGAGALPVAGRLPGRAGVIVGAAHGFSQVSGVIPGVQAQHGGRILLSRAVRRAASSRCGAHAGCASVASGPMLTPASPADLPPLGELIADDPFWHYPSATTADDGIAHLRVWTTATTPPGHLAVVTETGLGASVTEPAGSIWAKLLRGCRAPLVLLEHYLAPEAGGAESLDLLRIGAYGSPHWTRIWPTPKDNPRHAELELWMTAHGHQIVSRPPSDFRVARRRGRLPAAQVA
jgi:hypothetical protein